MGITLDMERLSGRTRNFVEMFGGVTPSRGAIELAKKAISLGEDPTALTREAGKAALRDGRNKVGFFGAAELPLNNLRAAIESIQGNKYMERSYSKFTKGTP